MIIQLDEHNFRDTLDKTAQHPVVFLFMSPRDPASKEMDTLLRRLNETYANQFILAVVNCDEQPMIAAQFQIQAVPTCYFFMEGQPVDAISGPLPEQELRVRLANILPKEDELKFNEALACLQNEQYEQALPLLKAAWELSDKQNSDFALLYAETYLAIKQVEPAKAILAQIPIQDRDSRWEGLQAQIKLILEASESPELQQLQADYAKNATPETAVKLANQLHQAHKNEEALTLLFTWLKSDLNVANGEVKGQFLAILSAIGNADPMVAKFRRQLYSLLY